MGPRFEDGVLDITAPAGGGGGNGPRFEDGTLPLWSGEEATDPFGPSMTEELQQKWSKPQTWITDNAAKWQAENPELTPYDVSVRGEAEKSYINKLPPIVSGLTRGIKQYAQKLPEIAGLALDSAGVPAPSGEHGWTDAVNLARAGIDRTDSVGEIDREGMHRLLADADMAAQSIGEIGLASATVPGGWLPYIGATSTRQGYVQAKGAGLDDSDAMSFAVKRGVVETALTYLGNKLLGGGLESAENGVLGRYIGNSLSKFTPQAAKPLLKVAGQSQAEAIEEVAVEAATWALEQEAGVPSGQPLNERLWQAWRVASIAGGGAEGIRTSIDTYAKVVEKATEDTKTVANAIKDANEYEGDPPPTDRRGFAKATGKQKTSQMEREAFAEAVRINRELEQAAQEDRGNPEPQRFTPEPPSRVRTRLREWTDDKDTIDAVSNLADYDVRIPQQVLDLAEQNYARDREVYEAATQHLHDVDVDWKYLIREYKKTEDAGEIDGFDRALMQLTRAKYGDDFVQDNVDVTADELSNILDGAEVRFGEVIFPNAHYPTKRAALSDAVDEVMQGANQERIESGEPEITIPQPVEPPIPESPKQLIESDPELVRRTIQSIIPSSRAVPQEDGSYRVELPNGQSFNLEFHEQIPLSDKEIASVLKQYGAKDTPENRQRLLDTAEGSFTLATPDGKNISGMGVVRLAARLQKDSPQRLRPVIRHEAFHFARQVGLITDEEFSALRRKYAPDVKNDAKAEEVIAKQSEAWEGDRGLLAYLRDAFDRFLAKLGLGKLTPRAAEQAFARGDVFTRRGKPLEDAFAGRASAIASLSANMDEDSTGSPVASTPSKRRAFRKWFRDSKMVDDFGRPLVLYHGSRSDVKEFSDQGTNTGNPTAQLGYFFTDSVDEAERYATQFGGKEGANITPVYLAIKNPYQMPYSEFNSLAMNIFGEDRGFVGEPSKEQIKENYKRAREIARARKEELKEQGYDGIVIDINPREYVAFEPSQIKSATGNQGTFSPDSPNISLSADPTSEYPDRFLDRANVSTDQRARQAMSEHDVAQGAPTPRAREKAVAEATARLADNYEGELQKFLGDIDNAEQNGTVINLTEADMVTARRLLSDLGVRMFEGDEEARKLHRKLSRGYRDARTEAARALGVRDPLGATDPSKSPVERRRDTLAEALNEESPALKKERKKAKTKEKRAEVDEKADAEWEKVRKRLTELGWDLSDVNKIANDPDKSIRLIQDASTIKSSWGDVFYEYWKNAILSGPQTHIVNATGNTIYSAVEMTGERAMEAAINLFVRDPKGAQLGEFKYLLGGFLPGWKRAVRNSIRAFNTESAAFQVEMGRAETEFEQGSRKAIPGRAGRFFRIPYRALMFADEFAKSMTATMEVGAQAYRIAKADGLSGPALQQRIEDMVNDIDSDAWSLAIDKSTQLAFQGEGGVLSTKVQKGAQFIRSHIPGARWVIPFVTTPANILEAGIRRTPVLGAILDYADARQRGHKMTDSGMSATLARQIIGFAGIGLLLGLNDPEDPWITGTEEEKDKRKRGLAYRTHPPQSIRIGDNWYSYSRIEPFATAVAATVDGVNSLRRGDIVGAAIAPISQLSTKTYLDGLGDLENAYRQGVRGNTPQERAEGIAEWGTNFASSWIPNIIRQPSRNARREYAERRVWGKGNEYWRRLVKRSAQGTEFRAIPDEARFDVWGRPIVNEAPGQYPASDLIFRVLSPVKLYDTDRMLDADLALYRWNAKNPTQQIYWEPPNPFYREDGETKYLSDEQYARFTELSGLLARKYIARVKISTENPTSEQMDRLKKAVSKGRTEARNRLKPYWKYGSDGAELIGRL